MDSVALLRGRVIIKAGDSLTGKNTLEDSAIRLGLNWIDLYPDDLGCTYVSDRLLRLPSVLDNDWKKIASQSLGRLDNNLITKE